MRLRPFLVLLAALFLIAVSAEAAEKVDPVFSRLRSAVSRVQKKKANQETATAGVKGAPEDATDELYWKGSETELGEKEADELQAILVLIEKGEKDSAIAGLEDFIKTHPESPVKADVEEEIKALKAGE
jgi:outer membrane protein assembly factor BamD (BamD/ComL family)